MTTPNAGDGETRAHPDVGSGPARPKLRVAVLFGGRSGEHEVSLASATSVLDAIDRDKYDVVPIGITRAGRWITAGDPLKALVEGQTERTTALALVPDPGSRDLIQIAENGHGRQPLGQIDVVFPVLHGPMGEDGTIQGLLEVADIPYVGAGVLGSALNMDKDVQKRLCRQHGLPVVRYEALTRREWERDPASLELVIESRFGYPCFVKPANMGSSVGISKARDRAELHAGIALAARYDRKIVVEEFVDAREIECSVLGNDEPQASLPGEICSNHEYYDYSAKYTDEGARLVTPADLPAEVTAEVRRLAVAAFKAMECAGMARVDFFLRRDNGQVIVNEVNTIPGFTAHSMYARMWEATGLSYTDLIDRLIQLALERHADRQRHGAV